MADSPPPPAISPPGAAISHSPAAMADSVPPPAISRPPAAMADSVPPPAISPPRASPAPPAMVDPPPPPAISPARAALSPEPGAISPAATTISPPRNLALKFLEASCLASAARRHLYLAAEYDGCTESSLRSLTEVLHTSAEVETAAAVAADLESSGRVLIPTAQHPEPQRGALQSAADVATGVSRSSPLARLLRSAEGDESTDPSRQRLNRDKRRRDVEVRFDSVRRLIIEAALLTDPSLVPPFCAVGVASEDPKSVRRSIRMVNELSSCRQKLFSDGEASVYHGKYEDAAHAFNVAACLGWDFSTSDTSLFILANSTFISELKYSMTSLEGKDLLFVKEEIKQWCCYVIQTVEKYLLPFATGTASIRYNQLKGFCWNIIADLDNDGAMFALSCTSYEAGHALAAELCATHPLRLSVTVDLVICLDTRLRCRGRATQIATEAWDTAYLAIRGGEDVTLIDQWETYKWLNWLGERIEEWTHGKELKHHFVCKRRPKSKLQYSYQQIRRGGCSDVPTKSESGGMVAYEVVEGAESSNHLAERAARDGFSKLQRG